MYGRDSISGRRVTRIREKRSAARRGTQRESRRTVSLTALHGGLAVHLERGGPPPTAIEEHSDQHHPLCFSTEFQTKANGHLCFPQRSNRGARPVRYRSRVDRYETGSMTPPHRGSPKPALVRPHVHTPAPVSVVALTEPVHDWFCWFRTAPVAVRYR